MMRTRMTLPTLTLVLCAAHCAVGQRPAPVTATPLQQELQRMGVAATELEHQLPSFTCREQITSEAVRGKKVLLAVHLTETLRIVRGLDGRLDESFQITEVEGKPFTEGTVKTPVYISGGFDRAISYFATDEQRCYRYTLAPGRIDFTGINPSPEPGLCKSPGAVGFALLDAEGNITHIERRIPPALASKEHMAEFAAVDFAPVELDGHIYRLSHHLLAERPVGKLTGRFEATYSDCRLYTATVTIHSADDSEAVHDAPHDSLPH